MCTVVDQNTFITGERSSFSYTKNLTVDIK